MVGENNKERISRKLNIIIDEIQKYTVRSYSKLLIHIFVATSLAVLFSIFLACAYIIREDSFVAIMSSISAASAVLLAVSLGLATFFSRHIWDWTDRLVYKLRGEEERLEKQMEKSAKLYPEISNHLSDIYLRSAFYIPGQEVDEKEIFKADEIFLDWTKEQAKKSTKKFSFGDLRTYESFEKHMFDAILRNKELRHTLIELGAVEKMGRPIITFSPLIITWVIITIYALVFSITGGMSVIPVSLNIPILIIPFYLFLVAVFALTKDMTAIIRSMRIRETGHELAMDELRKMANVSDAAKKDQL